MKKIIFCILCFLVLNLYAQNVEFPEAYPYDAQALIQKGIELHDAGKMDSAIIYFNRIHKDDPSYFLACYEKLLTFQAENKNKEIIDFVEKDLGSNELSKFPQLFVIYGSALDNEEKSKVADSIFQIGQTYMPYSANLYFNHAIVKIKLEKEQEAIDLLKKTIELDPSNSSALYFLGLTALDNGLLAQGCLALLTSICVEPDGKYTTDAILNLNAKMAQNFNNQARSTFSKTGDDFGELEEILENQLPLNAKYKLNCDIDDVVTRNIQAICEYAQSHQIKTGFFEQKFIPYLAKIAKEGRTESFIYYCLLSLNKESKVGKKVLSHMKEIEFFQTDFLQKGFWEIFGNRKDVYGIKEEVVVFYENSYPAMAAPFKNGMKQGAAIEMGKKGNIVVRSNYKNDKLEGLVIFYDENGNKTEEINYKEGLRNGENIVYFPEGNIEFKQQYVNDEIQGLYVSYYPNGPKYSEVNLIKGKIEGKFVYYFQNGKVQIEQNYKNGMLHGKSNFYNEVGELVSAANYIEGKLEGESVDYFDGKSIKAKGNYKKDVLISYTAYFPNGKVSEEINNNIKVIYNQFGNKIGEEYFDKDYEIQKNVSYDHEGKIATIEEFDDNGDLKGFRQYLNQSDKPIDVKTNKGSFVFKFRNGIKSVEGFFAKKKKEKQWTFYHQNGRIASKINYKNGMQNGLSIFYDKYGRIETVYNNIDSKLEGKSINYLRGKKNSTYHYKDGQLNGPFEVYTNDKLTTKGLFEDGKIKSKKEFLMDGKISTSANFQKDDMTERKIYGRDGKELFHHKFYKLNGKLNYNQDMYQIEENYKDGVLDGQYSIKISDGSPIKLTNFVNGKEHGQSLYYNFNGTISSDIPHHCGNMHGESKAYDVAGNLKAKYFYFHGDESGISERFYHSGKKFAEYSSIKNAFYGQNKYYNQDGDLVLKLNFANDFVISYSYLDKGIMKDSPAIDTNKVSITSTLANGTVVCKIDIKSMEISGKFVVFGQDGKPDLDSDFLNGNLHGKRLEYYANNKIYKSESFSYNDNEGLSEYFAEDGSKIVSINYSQDLYHGDCVIYKNGVKQKTMKFEYNDLIDIIKH